jgi:uncharacterized membrane-anchored protein
LPGYHAEAATTAQHIVIAAEVTIDSRDFRHLRPMVAATQRGLVAAGISEAADVVVAHAGYWDQAQMEDIVARGIRCSSRRTPTSARAHDRDGTGAYTRSCAAC